MGKHDVVMASTDFWLPCVRFWLHSERWGLFASDVYLLSWVGILDVFLASSNDDFAQ
jgi:hypothetical protein